MIDELTRTMFQGAERATRPKPKVDFNRMVRAYLNLRTIRREILKAYEKADAELEEKQNKIAAFFAKALNDERVESKRCEAGTFFRTMEIKPRAHDWQAFYEWIIEDDGRLEALEKRIKKTFIADYLKEHEGEPPPGVSVHREYVVRVRSPRGEE